MAIYAVVPVKNLADSKKRLSTVFTPRERQMLTLAMLTDVLNALKNSYVDKIVLVGEDSQVRKIAEDSGASYLELKGAKLNYAIDEASAFCIQRGASSVLVLPADIPLIKSNDINRIIQLAEGGDKAVVLSPSRNWGTNALYQRPPQLIPACFGSGSFLNHIKEAYQKSVSVRLHFSPELASDIDSAEDLKRLSKSENNTGCQRVLKQIVTGSKKARAFFDQKTNEKK